MKTYWYAGAAPASNSFSFDRIFIYHIPKTGTLTAYSSLMFSAITFFEVIKRQIPDYDVPEIARIDTYPNADTLKNIRHKNYYLIASHCPYGFHKEFDSSFKLVSIFRETFGRVLSAYTYHCMRTQQIPTLSEFETFIQREENRNIAAKQLAGINNGQASDEMDLADIATQRLQKEFFIYGTTGQIGEVCSSLLKMNKMPNVWTQHLNKTEKEYKLDGESFKEQILELNQHDVALYTFVKENPRMIKPPQGSLHPLTTKISEISNVENSKADVKIYPTQALMPVIEKGEFTQEEFDQV